jgi:hypothetical protein
MLPTGRHLEGAAISQTRLNVQITSRFRELAALLRLVFAVPLPKVSEEEERGKKLAMQERRLLSSFS